MPSPNPAPHTLTPLRIPTPAHHTPPLPPHHHHPVIITPSPHLHLYRPSTTLHPMAAAAAAATSTTPSHHHLFPLSSPRRLPPFPSLRLPRLRIPLPPTKSSSSPDPLPLPFDLDDKPREECGVVGIVGDPEASRLCSLALHALQHRGQEGAGIASLDDGTLRAVTGLGLVSDVFGRPNSLEPLRGSCALGHVRYSTAGAASSVLNVQPFVAGYRFGQVAVAHNGNFVNYPQLRASLEDRGSIFNTTSDTEVVLHLVATSRSRPFSARLVEACEQLEGAYSLVLLTRDAKMYAVRDPHGFRPLVMGRRRPNGAVVFASETCALDLIDAEYDREVFPGEVVIVDASASCPAASVTSMCLMPRRPRRACVFEHVYFALPNSVVFGHPVYRSRYNFGATLARESPAPGADVVIPVPDSGFFAALGFSERSGVPFQQGLIRSHYVGRTFIQPTQEIRDLGVRLKLAPVRGILEGKSVVVVDDSIVRGTTSSKIVRLLRDAGAREVHMRIASPPIVGSCYYGVDTPSSKELISNRMDVEGVRRYIGSDSLAFLSLGSLRDSLAADEADGFCDACFSRNYPVPPREMAVASVEL